MLASLQRKLLLGLALRALQTQDNLLGGLGLFAEDRLGLTTETLLLSVVTTLTLSVQRGLYFTQKSLVSGPSISRRRESLVISHLSSLVLGDLVLGVLVAVLGLAVRPAGFRNVDLVGAKKKKKKHQPLVLCFLVLQRDEEKRIVCRRLLVLPYSCLEREDNVESMRW